MTSGRLNFAINGHTNPVNSVKVSLDGQKIISASDDRTVKVWSIVDGKSIHAFSSHIGEASSVAFSTDGLRAVSGS